MRAPTTLLLAFVTLGSTSCALVFGYGDYTEAQPTTSTGGAGGSGTGTTTSAAMGGTGGTTTTSAATGGSGGSIAALAADWSYRGGDTAVQVFTHVSVGANGQILVVGDYAGSMDLFGAEVVTSVGFELVAAGLMASTPAPVWTKGTLLSPPAGTTFPRVGTSIAANTGGDVFVTASLQTAANGTLGVLIGLDGESGDELWQTTFDGHGSHGKSHIVADVSGRVRMINESLDGAFQFGTSSLPSAGSGGKDIALVTCTPPCAGGAMGIFGGPSDDTAFALAAEQKPLGAVFVTGEYRSTWSGMPDVGSVGSPFVMKVSDAGSVVWAKGFAKTEEAVCDSLLQQARGNAIALTSGGDVVVTGAMCGATDFGLDATAKPVILPGHGGADTFVVLLDGATGFVKWARSFGDAGDQVGTGVAVGAGDRLFVTGTFSGMLDLGGGQTLDAGTVSQSIFLLDLDPSGEPRRGAQFGAGEALEPRTINVAFGSGALVIAGAWKSTLAFGDGTTLPPKGSLDAFLAKLTP